MKAQLDISVTPIEHTISNKKKGINIARLYICSILIITKMEIRLPIRKGITISHKQIRNLTKYSVSLFIGNEYI